MKLWESLPTRTIALVLAFVMGWLLSDHLRVRSSVDGLMILADTVDELEDRMYEFAGKIGQAVEAAALPLSPDIPLVTWEVDSYYEPSILDNIKLAP